MYMVICVTQEQKPGKASLSWTASYAFHDSMYRTWLASILMLVNRDHAPLSTKIGGTRSLPNSLNCYFAASPPGAKYPSRVATIRSGLLALREI